MASRSRHPPSVTEHSAGVDGKPRSPYLLVVGNGQLMTVPLRPGSVLVVGRDAECDVRLAHGKISRRHARLVVDREIAIEDLGSTNGIRVRGVRIDRGVQTPLPFGEGVRLGPYTAIVLEGGVDGPATDEGRLRAALVVRDPTPAGATELLERVAKHDVNVLIQGETGTGKEVLARTLHQISGRPGDLVAINCAALTSGLLESELFGHEKGAFTGAARTKAGLLEIAGRGTALLDEIGDLPLELQGKLLRALESRQVYRVGGVRPIQLELRVIAATHRRLADEVARGTFREDLYFRLNGITLEIPPLRERRDAVAGLAAGFLERAAPRLTASALAALTAHDWPGNVRELRATVERALMLAGDAPITSAHLLLSSSHGAPAMADDDRTRFVAIAQSCKGNATAIAKALGTSRSQVRRLAERFEVELDALRYGSTEDRRRSQRKT